MIRCRTFVFEGVALGEVTIKIAGPIYSVASNFKYVTENGVALGGVDLNGPTFMKKNTVALLKELIRRMESDAANFLSGGLNGGETEEVGLKEPSGIAEESEEDIQI